MRITHFIFAFALLSSAATLSPAQAETALDKAAVEKIIQEYLAENPEAIIDSLESYREKQEQNQRTSASEKIQANQAYLTGTDLPSIGSADADVTVVEFFDYNCGYCRKALPDIQALAKEDKNVRFVFQEMPILSPSSGDIARWSLASHKQGKYFEFHAALMEHRGSKSTKNLKKLATKIGLDADKLETDANSSVVKAELAKSMDVARQIGIRGTPAFIVNGELYPGYLGEEGLKQSIEKARQNSDKKEE